MVRTPSLAAPQATAAADQAVEAAIDAAAVALGGRRLAVLTGAGVSTDSGIPDYRGAGAPARSPMTFQQFTTDLDYRKRYWAGSHLGWKTFAAAEPNSGHLSIAELESAGSAVGVITQNVDGLHHQAGSQRVVDLHGSLDRVRCLTCGQHYARASFAARLAEDNPWLNAPRSIVLSPDGDVEIEDVTGFRVPGCTVCGGILKPDVVFFGEFVPREKFDEASALIASAEALLIAGSSLVVNSGIRLLDQAVRRRMPVVIVNRGITKGDPRATVKIDAGTSETLAEIVKQLRD